MIVSDVSVVVSNNNNTECSVDHLLSIVEERNAAVLDKIKLKVLLTICIRDEGGGAGEGDCSSPQNFGSGSLYLKIIEGKADTNFPSETNFEVENFQVFFSISKSREFSPTSGILSADP